MKKVVKVFGQINLWPLALCNDHQQDFDVMYFDSGCDGTANVILSYCIWTEHIKLQMRFFQGFNEE